MTMLSRRHLLATLALTAGAAAVGISTAGAASASPKETGLPGEGLLAGRPGFQPRTIMPLSHNELPGFLSAGQLASHHAKYVNAVDALKEAEHALVAVDRGEGFASRYTSLRRQQVSAANAVLLHELYFGNLAAAKIESPRYIEGHVREHMGSTEQWTQDFTSCALAAKSWAVLVYDPYDDRWHNTVMDGNDDGVWMGANPLVVCDVAEHAFANDYRAREEYVVKFLEHLDWEEVARRYKRVDRM